jgi:hypothetical protein
MKLLLLALAAVSAGAQSPDIDEIMHRVAVNQAKSQDLRTSYLYRQKQVLKAVRGNGKVAREEHREYSIAPKVRGNATTLVSFDGKYEQHGKFIPYDKPGYQYKGTDIDGELLNDFSKDMMRDGKSRDGIDSSLFPMTYHQQLKYSFKLVGQETYRGRPVYRVAFEPQKKPAFDDLDNGGGIWKGEALIDAEEYQPINVHTDLAWKAPLFLKTVLGTNFRGIGFNVTYQKFADGVWFPVSYGGEFEIRAVFFYKRTFTVAMTNSDFRHTEVTSNVAYALEDKDK